MTSKKRTRRHEFELWSTPSNKDMLEKNVEEVLGAVTNLPLRFWQPKMLFTGAGDKDLGPLTQGEFPKKVEPKKTHPVFSLKTLPWGAGCMVCPCTSKRPYNRGGYRYIEKGCRLLHTHQTMDRDSYLVEKVRFNIPRSMAFRLRFRGVVPDGCLRRFPGGAGRLARKTSSGWKTA